MQWGYGRSQEHISVTKMWSGSLLLSLDFYNPEFLHWLLKPQLETNLIKTDAIHLYRCRWYCLNVTASTSGTPVPKCGGAQHIYAYSHPQSIICLSLLPGSTWPCSKATEGHRGSARSESSNTSSLGCSRVPACSHSSNLRSKGMTAGSSTAPSYCKCCFQWTRV